MCIDHVMVPSFAHLNFGSCHLLQKPFLQYLLAPQMCKSTFSNTPAGFQNTLLHFNPLYLLNKTAHKFWAGTMQQVSKTRICTFPKHTLLGGRLESWMNFRKLVCHAGWGCICQAQWLALCSPLPSSPDPKA